VVKREIARQATFEAWVALTLRVALGGLLVFSGLTKLPAHTAFVSTVVRYNIIPAPLATAYATVLPWAELIVGAYLLLGILTRASAMVAVLMGVTYVVANISSIVQGESRCASCFGQATSLPIGLSLAIDFLIIGAGLYLFFRGSRMFTLAEWLGVNRKSH